MEESDPDKYFTINLGVATVITLSGIWVNFSYKNNLKLPLKLFTSLHFFALVVTILIILSSYDAPMITILLECHLNVHFNSLFYLLLIFCQRRNEF